MQRLSKRQVRTAAINWMAAWPLVTLILATFEPLVSGWPMPLRTLLLTGIMVPAMVFWAVPAVTALSRKLPGAP